MKLQDLNLASDFTFQDNVDGVDCTIFVFSDKDKKFNQQVLNKFVTDKVAISLVNDDGSNILAVPSTNIDFLVV